jgi:hypothetical protein
MHSTKPLARHAQAAFERVQAAKPRVAAFVADGYQFLPLKPGKLFNMNKV